MSSFNLSAIRDTVMSALAALAVSAVIVAAAVLPAQTATAAMLPL